MCLSPADLFAEVGFFLFTGAAIESYSDRIKGAERDQRGNEVVPLIDIIRVFLLFINKQFVSWTYAKRKNSVLFGPVRCFL